MRTSDDTPTKSNKPEWNEEAMDRRHDLINELGRTLEEYFEEDDDLQVHLATAAGMHIGEVTLTREVLQGHPGMWHWFVQLCDDSDVPEKPTTDKERESNAVKHGFIVPPEKARFVLKAIAHYSRTPPWAKQ